LVVAEGAERVADAPEPGAVKLTGTPLTGLPKESLTNACSGVANGAKIVALCGVPALADKTAGTPGDITKAILCAEVRDVAVAETWYCPAVVKLRLEKVARPAAFVVAVVPDADGGRPEMRLGDSVTDIPACGTLFPRLSLTWTVTAGVIATPATALEGCWTKARPLAEPAMLLRLNAAGEAAPEVVALTVNEPT
jgi:hypothetical protein